MGEFDPDGRLNVDPTLPCWYLFRDEGKPVAFLFLFCPTREEVEVSAFTLEAYRKQGCFSALFSKAVVHILERDFRKILFCIPGSSKSGHIAVSSYPAILAFREYSMVLAQKPPRTEQKGVTMVMAEEASYTSLFGRSLKQENDRQVYIGMKDGKPFGTISLHPMEEGTWVYGFEVLPACRRQGLGEALLTLAIGKASSMPLLLEVESDNTPALSLYGKIGFTERSSIDYYRMEVPHA